MIFILLFKDSTAIITYISSKTLTGARAMTKTTKPTKEQVRQTMDQHRKERTLPTPDEYRRQLGWTMLPNNKGADCAR